MILSSAQLPAFVAVSHHVFSRGEGCWGGSGAFTEIFEKGVPMGGANSSGGTAETSRRTGGCCTSGSRGRLCGSVKGGTIGVNPMGSPPTGEVGGGPGAREGTGQ